MLGKVVAICTDVTNEWFPLSIFKSNYSRKLHKKISLGEATLILFYKQHIIKKTSWTVAYKTEWVYAAKLISFWIYTATTFLDGS